MSLTTLSRTVVTLSCSMILIILLLYVNPATIGTSNVRSIRVYWSEVIRMGIRLMRIIIGIWNNHVEGGVICCQL